MPNKPSVTLNYKVTYFSFTLIIVTLICTDVQLNLIPIAYKVILTSLNATISGCFGLSYCLLKYSEIRGTLSVEKTYFMLIVFLRF